MKTINILSIVIALMLGAVSSINAQCTVSFTSNTTPNGTTLTATSNVNGPNSWYVWDWGTGQNTWNSISNPTVTTPLPNGIHYVCVTVMDSIFCTATYCDTVVVSGNNSGGGGNGNMPCNTSVSFQSNATASGTTVNASTSGFNSWAMYTWTWDNGQVTYTSTPNTTAPTGASSVCLTVDDSLCIDTYCDSIAMINSGGGNGNPCNISSWFTSASDSLTGGVAFFSNVSGGTAPYTYAWDFGNGTMATGQNPVSTSATFGLVCLTVTDAAGCVALYCDSIAMINSGGGNGNPCNISSWFTSASDSLTGGVAFFGNVSGGTAPYTYAWDFGNGTMATGQNPVSTSAAFGLVCLTVTDAAGCVALYCDSIGGNNSGGGNGTPCALNEVTLLLNFDNFATETSWELVDAAGNIVHSGSGYSNMYNATPLYETFCLSTGCYDFIIYDSYGDGICCAWGQGSYSLVDANGTILAAGGSFAYQDQTNICVGGATNPCGNFFGTFSYSVDSATGDVTFTPQLGTGAQGSTITWDFDNGATSTMYSPTVAYSNNGVYNVCMTAVDSAGCTFTYCDGILITSNSNNNNNNPCAGMSVNINMVQDSADPFTIWMQPVVNGAPSAGMSFIWDFGDNTGAISGMPTHFYNNYGSYVVCVMAIDTLYGCAATFCDTITIDSSGNFSRNITKPGLNVNILSPVINTITSVDDLNSNTFDMSLFPNPVDRVVNLSVTSTTMTDAAITIMDISGKTVQHQIATLDEGEQTLTLDVEQLPAGVYLVNLTSEDAQKTMKFIKR